jgi:hypothetical protein
VGRDAAVGASLRNPYARRQIPDRGFMRSGSRTPPRKECSMLDLIYLVLGFAFFALMALYLRFVAQA